LSLPEKLRGKKHGIGKKIYPLPVDAAGHQVAGCNEETPIGLTGEKAWYE